MPNVINPYARPDEMNEHRILIWCDDTDPFYTGELIMNKETLFLMMVENVSIISDLFDDCYVYRVRPFVMTEFAKCLDSLQEPQELVCIRDKNGVNPNKKGYGGKFQTMVDRIINNLV